LDPPSPRTDDNEKLEFLGDSILGFVISDMLFRARPDLREGDLSRIKAFIVSAANLVRAAEGIGLGAYLRLGRGEEKTGGREKRALLVDALEALLAAVYLDGGLDPAIRIIADLFDAQVREFAASGDQVSDFKSVLQERLQAEGRPPARYQLVEESGPSHERFFTVAVLIDNDSAGTGQGPNKKAAEQCAAMDALTRYPAFQR
jgi:ribonuclease-3